MGERRYALSVVRDFASERLEQIVSLFNPGHRIALVVWNPDAPEQDFVLADGPIPEAIAAMQRRSPTPSPRQEEP